MKNTEMNTSAGMRELKNFHSGDSCDCYKFLGSKCVSKQQNGKSVQGVHFSVWAPAASEVRVVGDFNSWDGSLKSGPLSGKMRRGQTGIWRVFIPGIFQGCMYKYKITGANGKVVYKADPMAFYSELRPGTASVVYDLRDYAWTDGEWMQKRAEIDYVKSPLNIYEIHLGSWKRGTAEGLPGTDTEQNEDEAPFLSYRETADLLGPYLQSMHYTHVEIMPVSEHPLDASWGYQTQCYYSITSRYGTPDDFRYLVNRLHECGIGVILDWVPGHFCKDLSGLYCFDGSWLYEDDEEEIRENRAWGTSNFDLGKGEVQSFLISNAMYFFKEYHVDGLRVDAVANMLYLDYGKTPSPKLKNKYGGIENIDAIDFCRKLNKALFTNIQNPLVIAEESTAWPLVTKPDYIGGLGFNFKWNMGWMNDTLEYIRTDSYFRQYNHTKMTFSIMYAYAENYILPLSHDEVVHGKKSLLDKCFGEYEQKFDALRCFYTYMMGHPGKKLLFMGGEFGPFIEWRYYEELEWNLLQFPKHSALKEFVAELNYLYKNEKAFWEQDDGYDSFEWIDADNASQNTFSFIRKAKDPKDFLIIVCNFSPIEYDDFKIGIPRFADYEELLNTDDKRFGGKGAINCDPIRPEPMGWNGRPFRISFKLPAGGAVIFKPKFMNTK